MPYVEHLIATGVIADPTPLTRPLRRGDLVRALRAADTVRVSAVTRRTVRLVLTALADRRPAPFYRIEGAVRIAAARTRSAIRSSWTAAFPRAGRCDADSRARGSICT